MTIQEERRCRMMLDVVIRSVRDLVEVHTTGSAFHCRDCGGVSTREICPRCEVARDRKLLAEQIKEARA